MSNSNPDKRYTYDHVVLDDQSVAFKCRQDAAALPWLALPPSDPIVVQMATYFSSVEAAIARNAFEASQWSALTAHHWECRATGEGAAHASHGLVEPSADPDSPSFAATFFNEQGDIVYRMTGEGVFFRTRDFKAWREKNRQTISALPACENFVYAGPDDLGVASESECLSGPLLGEGTPDQGGLWADALITSENGFAPGHPYHAGSGDHVNAPHILDAVRQAAHMARRREGFSLTIRGGKAAFSRYIELGHPFRVGIENQTPDETQMTVSQGDRLCSTVTLSYGDEGERFQRSPVTCPTMIIVPEPTLYCGHFRPLGS